MKRKVGGQRESGRLHRRKVSQMKSRRRLSLSEVEVNNDHAYESADSQSSTSSFRSKGRSARTDGLDGFIVDDEDEIYGKSSCSSPKSTEHDEPLGYSLYCVMCAKWVHKDSFSAHQRRLGEHGDDCYCLLHTAGNHKHYVERLQMTAMRNDDGDDEAAEETHLERSRRQREAWKRQNWAFFDRPGLEEPEAKLVGSDELNSLSRRAFSFRESFGSDHLDNVIAKYSELIDPDEDAPSRKKLKSRTVGSKKGRRRVSAPKRRQNRDYDTEDSNGSFYESHDAVDDDADDEPSAAVPKRRKRVVSDDEEDDAPLHLDKKRRRVIEDDDDNNETPAPTRKRRRRVIDHDDDEENDPLSPVYQKLARPVDDCGELVPSAQEQSKQGIEVGKVEEDHKRPYSTRKKQKQLIQNNDDEDDEPLAPILRKRRRIIDDAEDDAESPQLPVKLKRRRIIDDDDDDDEEPSAHVGTKSRRVIDDDE